MISIQRLFPWLAIGISLMAWYDPTPLMGLQDAIIPLLSMIMFCMGLVLRVADFQRVARKPKPIFLGVALQFLLMPLLAWFIGVALQLPPELAVGLIVVGACAGGTASNVMTFLAGGDVALSVSMTLTSTLLGVFLTPWLIGFYTSANVEVDSLGMVISIAQIVVLPIIAGLLANRLLPQVSQALFVHLPNIASTLILLIIGIVVAVNANDIGEVGFALVVAVMLHNLLGLAMAYALAKLTGQPEVVARTIAFEVGMQNSGLGVALAFKFFGPASALPGALFSIWHNISASLLVAYWKWQTDKKVRNLRR